MIQFKNVSYQIENRLILDRVNFIIKDNEKVLLMGKSGSGKSTIFNLITRMIKNTKGTIYYDKSDISKYSNNKLQNYRKDKVIMINQIDDLFDNLTVLKNLTLFYYEQDVITILNKAKIGNLKDRIVSSLSGGERQRVAICKACLSNCEVLLADEITSALDYENATRIIDFILNLFKNKTVIFIAHDKSIFDNKINHFLYLEKGKIVKDELIKEVNKIEIYNFKKKTKGLTLISLKNGFKKFSLISLIIMIMVIVCLYISFNFESIFSYYASMSYKSYFDYDVALIVDNNDLSIDIENNIYPSLEPIFEKSSISINNISIKSSYFKPFNNKNNYKQIVINSQLAEKYDFNNSNIIVIKSNNISYVNTIEIIKEEGMFVKPSIYYDITYFYQFYNNEISDLYIIDYDITNIDSRFTNNPMFIDKSEDKPYLESNAYSDYLTYKMVFDSIYEIVDYYFVTIMVYAFITLVLVNFSIIYKDKKEIAIYIQRGYKDYQILLTYFIGLFINSFVLSFILFLDNLLVPYLLAVGLDLITLVLSYYYIKSKSLRDSLKEDL